MSQPRLTPVLLALLVVTTLAASTACAQTAGTPTGRTETVIATVDAAIPLGGRYVGSITAGRTEMKTPKGSIYLETRWTFVGTRNGKPARMSGVAREYWTGTARTPKERVEIVSLTGHRKLPITSVTIAQTRVNAISVGGLFKFTIDGWLRPPFTRTTYRISHAGQKPTDIGILPGSIGQGNRALRAAL